MKKQIPWSTILNTAIPLLIVSTVIVLLIILSGNSDISYDDPQIITPIDFTPSVNLADEDVLVAENDGFALWANLATTKITLYQKDKDIYFTSVPETLEEEDIKNSAKFQLSALLSFRYSDRDSNAYNNQNCFTGSVRKGDYRAQRIENGVRFDFYFDNEGFLIPLEITLTQTGIKATVPLKDIRERSNRILLTGVTVLPNFGAARANDEGYMLLPDGSGMLADFSTRNFTYSQRIYGKDYAVINSTSSGSAQTARMPIYGIKQGNGAFLSVISSGAARAYVEANAPTTEISTQNFWTIFSLSSAWRMWMKRWHTSPPTPPGTAKPSSPVMMQPLPLSPPAWTAPRSMSMLPPGSPTAANSVWAARWAFPPRSSTPGVPWVFGS